MKIILFILPWGIVLILAYILIITQKKHHAFQQNLAKAKSGDFTQKMKSKAGDTLASDYNTLIDRLRQFISQMDTTGEKINQNTHYIRDYTKDIKSRIGISANTMEDMSKQFESQAYAIHQTATKSSEMIEQFKIILESTSTAANQANDTMTIINKNISIFDLLSNLISQNVEVSQSIKQSMGQLDDKISEIRSIASTVRDISDSTNMLALNASIEAARAGEAGAGFAVVAQEVKKLADESAVHANGIDTLIETIRKEVTQISDCVQKSTDSMDKTQKASIEAKAEFLKTVAQTKTSVDCIRSIHQLTQSENDKISEIGKLMIQANSFLQTATASIQETTSSIQEESNLVDEIFSELQKLAGMTTDIQKLTSAFSEGFVFTDAIKKYVSDSLSLLKKFAEQTEIKSFKRETCDTALQRIFSEHQIFESVTVFDAKGDTIGIGIDSSLYDDSLYTNFAHRPYFIEAITGKTYSSSPYISSDTFNYCVAIAVPIFAGNQIKGVLMADLHLG